VRLSARSPVGAQVDDLALERATDAEIGGLRLGLGVHGVVVARDQKLLGDAAFVTLLSRLGRLTFTRGETPVPGHPDLNVITNVGRSTPPRSSFHVDTSYVARPPAYTALRAVTLPERGGETLFSNQYRAFETLSEGIRDHLAGRSVRHVVTGIAPDALGPDDERAAEHPLALRHPLTGRWALYVTTPERCAGISGLNAAESRRLISFLYAHSTQPGNVYRHRWQPGDVVFWDNRCVMHRADHAGVIGDRVLHRGVVLEPNP
jgi:taurine dioxygenase